MSPRKYANIQYLKAKRKKTDRFSYTCSSHSDFPNCNYFITQVLIVQLFFFSPPSLPRFFPPPSDNL